MANQSADFKLPDAVIARIIKNSLPEGASVGKIARKSISHASAIFVLYTTTQAMRHAAKSNRKMVSGVDVLKAMEEMDFAEFVPELEDTLQRFRTEQGAKNQSKEKPAAAATSVKPKPASASKENAKPKGRKSASK